MSKLSEIANKSPLLDPFRYESSQMMRSAMRLVKNNHIEGDYAEFGASVSTTVEAWNAGRELDIKYYIYFNDCSKEDFERSISHYGVEAEIADFGTLKQTDTHKFALVWINCDTSAPTVLEYLTSRLSSGSILIFNNWFRYNKTKGERLACQEWLERNKHISLTEYQNFHWAGKSFIVNIAN